MQKECKKHGLTNFYSPSGRNPRCSKCASEAVTKRRHKLKVMAVEYKGGSCQKCGYNKSIAALEFHHLDPSKKDFGIANKGHTKSWDSIKKELDKCILVCSNCHREIHD